jgi:hypothetical protein
MSVTVPPVITNDVDLLKLQLGVVFKVNVLQPAAVGVPVAISTIF